MYFSDQTREYCAMNFLFRLRGTGYSSVCIYVKNVHEVRRSPNTDNTRNIYEKVPASINARDSNRVQPTFCAFQVFNQNQ